MACYLINCMPTPTLKNQLPFEILFKCANDYKFYEFFVVLTSQNFAPITQIIFIHNPLNVCSLGRILTLKSTRV